MLIFGSNSPIFLYVWSELINCYRCSFSSRTLNDKQSQEEENSQDLKRINADGDKPEFLKKCGYYHD